MASASFLHCSMHGACQFMEADWCPCMCMAAMLDKMEEENNAQVFSCVCQHYD
jgi:hypothetical protein